MGSGTSNINLWCIKKKITAVIAWLGRMVQRLTGRRHKGNFCRDGHVLHLDQGLSCIGVCSQQYLQHDALGMLLGKEKRPILTVPLGRCLGVNSSRVLCVSDIMKDPGPFFHSILLPSKAGFLFSSPWSYDQHSNPNGALNGTWIKSVSYRVK